MGESESLNKEKARILAELYGFSQTYANAYVEGEYCRRRGEPLGAYLRVGLDEYALGFRAGYFARQNPTSVQVQSASTPKRELEFKRRN